MRDLSKHLIQLDGKDFDSKISFVENEGSELEWVAVEISQLNFELNCVYSAAKRRKIERIRRGNTNG